MILTITNYYDPVGSVNLSKRCPDCGNSDSLELTFYQLRIESNFSTQITNKVSGVLYCHNTNTEISPVQWSEDIQRIFNTEKQKLKLQPKSRKFNKWFYGLITFLVVFALVLTVFIMKESNANQNLTKGVENVSPGDKFEIIYSNEKLSPPVVGATTWFLVKKVESDTIWLQRHNKLDSDRSQTFELDDSNFTEEVLKASLKEFNKRTFMGHNYLEQKFSGMVTDVKSK